MTGPNRCEGALRISPSVTHSQGTPSSRCRVLHGAVGGCAEAPDGHVGAFRGPLRAVLETSAPWDGYAVQWDGSTPLYG